MDFTRNMHGFKVQMKQLIYMHYAAFVSVFTETKEVQS